MNKYLHLLIFISTISTNAQVGINTNNPSATLDIVSPGTTSTTKALEINNSAPFAARELVTVLDNGNTGINTPNPDNKLVITPEASSTNTGLKLPRGAGNGLFLVSDNVGNATWNTRNMIFGNVPASGVLAANFFPTANNDYYTQASIVVPAGNWIIEFGAYFQLFTRTNSTSPYVVANENTVITTDSSIWCSCSLSTSSTSYSPLSSTNGSLITGSGTAGAGSIGRGQRATVMHGKILVKPETAITYYVFARCTNYGTTLTNSRAGNIFGPGWERWFFAIPF